MLIPSLHKNHRERWEKKVTKNLKDMRALPEDRHPNTARWDFYILSIENGRKEKMSRDQGGSFIPIPKRTRNKKTTTDLSIFLSKKRATWEKVLRATTESLQRGEARLGLDLRELSPIDVYKKRGGQGEF